MDATDALVSSMSFTTTSPRTLRLSAAKASFSTGFHYMRPISYLASNRMFDSARHIRSACLAWYLIAALIAAPCHAEPPPEFRRKKPKSATELLREGAEAPTTTTAPSTQVSDTPFGERRSRPDYALPGVVILSDGRKLPGYIWTPAGKEWRVYERASRQYRDIPFDVIRQIDAIVEWERMEDDWRWKEGGSDVKVLTGHKYPNRKTYFSFTLVDDRKVIGDIAQMAYVELAGHATQVTLHKRHEGRIGQTLADIPYVKQMILDPGAMADAIREITSSKPASRRTPLEENRPR
jgi:hypothetical protein